MITDADITKLKEDFATKDDLRFELTRFATKDDLKEATADVRADMGEMNDKIDTLASAIGRIENTLDGIAGAIQDQRTENGAGAVHLARHDRQIEALAFATSVALPD